MTLDYRYPSLLLDGTLLRRSKRFLADVELAGGRRLTAHCANPGSMRGVDVPGRPVRVRDSGEPSRKLRYSLEQVRPGRAWVGVNTALPNPTVAAAIQRGALPSLRGYPRLRREVDGGAGSRFDIRLEDGRRHCWVEVKNVTLKVGREARFPDAVTARGLRHLEHLADLVRAGDRAVMLYFVARADVDAFRPAWEIDPAYGEGLVAAVAAGVEVLPVRAQVRRAGLRLGPLLPYDLGHA